MTNDASNLPKDVSTPPIEGRVAPPFDDPVAASLRGFGPLGLLAILVIVLTSAVFKPLSAMLVLVWAWRSHTPWREIGYVRPRSWLGSLAVGVVFGCAFKLFMKVIVMPLLGAPEINPAYHYLVGNRAALPGVVFTMIVGAGFGETVFRGYLFERLGKLFGERGPSSAKSIHRQAAQHFGTVVYCTWVMLHTPPELLAQPGLVHRGRSTIRGFPAANRR